MATDEDIPIELASTTRDPQEKEDVDKNSAFDEIDKLTFSKLPPELRTLDLEKLKHIYSNAKSISFLITGKTGSGKSTLTNGILGMKVDRAKEGSSIDKGCTTEVTSYHTKKGDIDVTVWDSPGLQDGTENQEEYLTQMKEKCSERDLTMYCIKISETRFLHGDENPDVLAMRKLTEKFSDKFWSNVIIVLTFANTLEAFNVEWECLPPIEKAKEYKMKIQQWDKQIREILNKDIKVPDHTVKAIRIVPAGHYLKPHIPGYRYWLSVLWFHCVGTIQTPEVRAAFTKINASRFKMEKNVTKKDFKNPPEQQPIVVNDHTLSALDRVGIASITTTGAAIGGAVGALGLIGGPLVALTIPLGIGIGGGVCLLVAALVYKYS